MPKTKNQQKQLDTKQASVKKHIKSDNELIKVQYRTNYVDFNKKMERTNEDMKM